MFRLKRGASQIFHRTSQQVAQVAKEKSPLPSALLQPDRNPPADMVCGRIYSMHLLCKYATRFHVDADMACRKFWVLLHSVSISHAMQPVIFKKTHKQNMKRTSAVIIQVIRAV